MNLRRWVRRLLSLAFVLFASSTCGYLLLRAAPGDPVEVLSAAARDSRPERKQELRHQFGLDQSAWRGALSWSLDALRGDFGRSFIDGRLVLLRIVERLPTTLGLALLAVALSALLGLFLGRRVAVGHAWATLGLPLAYALPTAGLCVIALGLGAPYGRVASIFPAALCLALPLGASTARQVAAALSATLREPFVTTLRARGLPEAMVQSHALVASLGPAIALLFGQLPALLSGALVVEVLLGVPGLGLLAQEALLGRDYPMVLGLLVVSSVTALVSSWIGDAVRGAVDPRLLSDEEV